MPRKEAQEFIRALRDDAPKKKDATVLPTESYLNIPPAPSHLKDTFNYDEKLYILGDITSHPSLGKHLVVGPMEDVKRRILDILRHAESKKEYVTWVKIAENNLCEATVLTVANHKVQSVAFIESTAAKAEDFRKGLKSQYALLHSEYHSKLVQILGATLTDYSQLIDPVQRKQFRAIQLDYDKEADNMLATCITDDTYCYRDSHKRILNDLTATLNKEASFIRQGERYIEPSVNSVIYKVVDGTEAPTLMMTVPRPKRLAFASGKYPAQLEFNELVVGLSGFFGSYCSGGHWSPPAISARVGKALPCAMPSGMLKKLNAQAWAVANLSPERRMTLVASFNDSSYLPPAAPKDEHCSWIPGYRHFKEMGAAAQKYIKNELGIEEQAPKRDRAPTTEHPS